jgi:hypothetical protein
MAVQVSRIYAALQSGLAIGVAGLVNRTELAVHLFFADGSYRYDWPDQGLIGDFSHDRAKSASFWGRWHSDGPDLVVERPGAVVRFTVEPDAIVDQAGQRFGSLPLHDDTDLTGLWLREASVSDKPRIVFLEGNRFATEGGLLGLIAEPHFVADWGPLAGRSLFEWPDGGGRYDRGFHTLELTRDDGARVLLLSLAAENRMRLGYTWFTRAG